MEQITTEKEIDGVVANLVLIDQQLTVLLGMAQKSRVKLIMDFSADCTEFGQQAEIINQTRQMFYNSIDNLLAFQEAIKELGKVIEPGPKNSLNKNWPPKEIQPEDLDWTTPLNRNN
ncbi:hypothetical protein [Mucilaginibacter sp.]|uniref:hypothetical protein n=1 Tax=Mucilaginibacter sp. TaxID=1882438 RepID=UPI0025D43342|nr:hypothetical protein [Mucilaginibacter sp.]